jgi:hypothetical protein
MYIPQNWEFDPAFSKLRNFGGGGGVEPANHPPGYASGDHHEVHGINTPETNKPMAANVYKTTVVLLMMEAVTFETC